MSKIKNAPNNMYSSIVDDIDRLQAKFNSLAEELIQLKTKKQEIDNKFIIDAAKLLDKSENTRNRKRENDTILGECFDEPVPKKKKKSKTKLLENEENREGRSTNYIQETKLNGNTDSEETSSNDTEVNQSKKKKKKDTVETITNGKENSMHDFEEIKLNGNIISEETEVKQSKKKKKYTDEIIEDYTETADINEDIDLLEDRSSKKAKRKNNKNIEVTETISSIDKTVINVNISLHENQSTEMQRKKKKIQREDNSSLESSQTTDYEEIVGSEKANENEEQVENISQRIATLEGNLSDRIKIIKQMVSSITGQKCEYINNIQESGNYPEKLNDSDQYNENNFDNQILDIDFFTQQPFSNWRKNKQYLKDKLREGTLELDFKGSNIASIPGYGEKIK